MTTDFSTAHFSAQMLFDRVRGSSFDLEDFRLPDWTSDEPKYGYEAPFYKDEDDKVTSYCGYRVARDDRGFPIVDHYQVVDVEDEDDLYVDDFMYEGGFVPGLGYFRMVDNGHHGDGHEAWCLVEHESGRLFRIYGYYSSWDSSSWDGIHEVVPAEVKVVRYKDINSDVVFDDPAVTVE